MESKPVEVISRYMGGKFKAIITIRKSFPYPNRMKVDVKVTEIPGKKSLIPGESVITVPSTKKIKHKTSAQYNGPEIKPPPSTYTPMQSFDAPPPAL